MLFFIIYSVTTVDVHIKPYYAKVFKNEAQIPEYSKHSVSFSLF